MGEPANTLEYTLFRQCLVRPRQIHIPLANSLSLLRFLPHFSPVTCLEVLVTKNAFWKWDQANRSSEYSGAISNILTPFRPSSWHISRDNLEPEAYLFVYYYKGTQTQYSHHILKLNNLRTIYYINQLIRLRRTIRHTT